MSNEILQIGNVIGYVLQSIYLAYFMICVKNLKTKRIFLLILIFLDFILLKYVCNLHFTINFDILLGIFIFLILKLLYGDKARITDFITYIISSLILGIISILCILLFGVNIISVLVGNLIPILITFLLRHKLIKIDEFYNKFWNRHSNSKMLKSITIRGFSSVLTIMTFLLAHIWLIYGILVIRR